MQFKMPGKVYGVAMSSVSTTHMLIAAGTEDVQVRLCDMASGAFTHTLSGHRDGVWAIQWSASNEWIVVTGGCDGAIRFWDIRRAGCFRVLDQFQSQTGRRPPILKSTAAKTKFLASSNCNTTKTRAPQRKGSFGNGMESSIQLGKGKAKVPLTQKQHRGMLSTQNRAAGHYGAVTGLQMTNDGLHLFSAGTDSRLRLWDVESGCNTLVNYEGTRIRPNKATQLAVTPNSSLVFVPCLTSIKAYDVWSGRLCSTFHGHYDFINCCSFNSQDQELYTGSNDRQILIWSPPAEFSLEKDENPSRGAASLFDEDNWSD
uniref:Anaphase-promoting complex subunit 4 WD40 domain-containing protein n=1 Tax=Araucaria cunninghamii TaxID=56994 RepID=A0A0D6R8M7_ARACU